ncbi:MAG TPA: DNA alkylation repair protein [Opitutaceae bacterium]|nr:DNA alkylation repair protein [Opitutaceae bacterium]
MAEPFKNLISRQTVAQAGRHLARVWPEFDRTRFEQLAGDNLEKLELKARAMQIADALAQALPADFSRACDILEASLTPPLGFDADGEPIGLGEAARDAGLSGWAVWSMGEYVARHGMDNVPRALACLHALTQRFSAEFAIRPFIQRHPQATLAVLAKWTRDPSAHVRRLVSEGSRPRLPWGLRLQALVADPSPTLPLLRALQDDSSAYVRRSVANHLNDIAKDHPDLVAAWVHEHLTDASPERIASLRHASRSLIKAGHPATLEAWGLGRALRGKATLELATAKVRIGAKLGMSVQLRSTHSAPQPLVIDYAVLHVRANGDRSRKVFKGWKFTLAAGEKRTLTRQHSFRPVTTRRLYPGPHRIDLLVNGQIVAGREFALLPA